MTPMCHRGSQGPFSRSQEIRLLGYLNLTRNPNPTRPRKIRTKCVQNEYTFQNAKSVTAVATTAYDKENPRASASFRSTAKKPDQNQTVSRPKRGEGHTTTKESTQNPPVSHPKTVVFRQPVAKNFPIHCTEVNKARTKVNKTTTKVKQN
jgi:hypothetical protein